MSLTTLMGLRAAYAKQYLRDKLLDHKAYIDKHGEDMLTFPRKSGHEDKQSSCILQSEEQT